MANQLQALLDHWHSHQNDRQWVLGTIYKTQGPCYRKAGAMMLFDDLGKYYGLLSGGCLESDLQRHALQVMRSGMSKTLCYDGSDEGDLSFLLGIGCGGTVHILLQPVVAQNRYLQLDQLYSNLLKRKPCHFLQKIPIAGEAQTEIISSENRIARSAQLVRHKEALWLRTPIEPIPHILIVGGGVDARPMAQVFRTQGWQVSLCDPRPANGREAYFPGCDCYHCSPENLLEQPGLQRFNAAVIMSHNLQLDATALRTLYRLPLQYLGLLGPVSRRDRVLQLAGLRLEQLATRLHAPIGLNLGGELPEGIALSTCAEIHAILHLADGLSLSRAGKRLMRQYEI